LSFKSDIIIKTVLPERHNYQISRDFSSKTNIIFHDFTKPKELVQLMLECDAAITNGAGSCLETASIGLPTLIVAVANNQVLPGKAMDSLQLAIYCENIFDKNSSMRQNGLKTLEKFLWNSALRNELANNCSIALPNSGVELVSKNFEEQAIDLIL